MTLNELIDELKHLSPEYGDVEIRKAEYSEWKGESTFEPITELVPSGDAVVIW